MSQAQAEAMALAESKFWMARLSDAVVEAIRSEHRAAKQMQRKLAEKYGVSEGYLSQIVNDIYRRA